ncbi:hypothetical protein ACTFIW_006787 [Dictyostelium discoideum]
MSKRKIEELNKVGSSLDEIEITSDEESEEDNNNNNKLSRNDNNIYYYDGENENEDDENVDGIQQSENFKYRSPIKDFNGGYYSNGCLGREIPIIIIKIEEGQKLKKDSSEENGQTSFRYLNMNGPIIFCLERVIFRISTELNKIVDIEIPNEHITSVKVIKSPINKDLEIEIKFEKGSSYILNNYPPRKPAIDGGSFIFTSKDKIFNEDWKFYFDKCGLQYCNQDKIVNNNNNNNNNKQNENGSENKNKSEKKRKLIWSEEDSKMLLELYKKMKTPNKPKNIIASEIYKSGQFKYTLNQIYGKICNIKNSTSTSNEIKLRSSITNTEEKEQTQPKQIPKTTTTTTTITPPPPPPPPPLPKPSNKMISRVATSRKENLIIDATLEKYRLKNNSLNNINNTIRVEMELLKKTNSGNQILIKQQQKQLEQKQKELEQQQQQLEQLKQQLQQQQQQNENRELNSPKTSTTTTTTTKERINKIKPTISLDEDNQIISINSATIIKNNEDDYYIIFPDYSSTAPNLSSSSSSAQPIKKVNIIKIKTENDFIQCEVESIVNDKIINTSTYYIKNENGFEISTRFVRNGDESLINCLFFRKIKVPHINDNFIIVNNKKT